jgi:glycosyltransferase involved in cell wall biosynthesis
VPWFPFDSLLRRLRPGYRAGAPRFEAQDGFDVWYPRFLSVPGTFKSLDGIFMALGAWARLRSLRRAARLDVIDAHFGYPDGYAAVLLGKWLKVPVTVTMRGTEARHAKLPRLRRKLFRALSGAARVFSVSESLRRVAVSIGIAADRVRVVGNGVDSTKFAPLDKIDARQRLKIPPDASVLISVGGLVERKGFHRVLEVLPKLRRTNPKLVYLVVGGPSAEGDWTERLKAQSVALGVDDCVRFLGPLPSSKLRVALSAADVFVLATANEGWANVFLEAMACGLPVVTTDVGGNNEVVSRPELGTIVPFGDAAILRQKITEALARSWDRNAIRQFAVLNSWDERVSILAEEFRAIASRGDVSLARTRDVDSRPNDAPLTP